MKLRNRFRYAITFLLKDIDVPFQLDRLEKPQPINFLNLLKEFL